MGLILDSSIFIGEERKQFDLKAFYAAHPLEIPYLAAITASELLHGVERASPAYKTIRFQKVESVLASIETVDFDLAVARRHASLWAMLEASGKKLDAHDLLIGATALHYGFSVATLNLKHFDRIPGLHLVDTAPYLLKKPDLS